VIADVLILTSADGEDAAVRDFTEHALAPWKLCEDKPWGFQYDLWYTQFAAANGQRPIRVVLARAPDQREAAAAGIAAALITHFKPVCLAMCGVCAGRPGEVNLGDVIIADKVWKYDGGAVVQELGSVAPVFQPEIETYQLPKHWKSPAESFQCSLLTTADRFSERPTPEDGKPWATRVGGIATGANLVRDPRCWDFIASTQNRKVLGIEMEAVAVGWLGVAVESGCPALPPEQKIALAAHFRCVTWLRLSSSAGLNASVRSSCCVDFPRFRQ
jgi:nucleoside phosphorylase